MSRRLLRRVSFADLVHCQYRLHRGDHHAEHAIEILGYQRVVDGLPAETVRGRHKGINRVDDGTRDNVEEVDSDTPPVETPQDAMPLLRLPVVASRELATDQETQQSIVPTPQSTDDNAFIRRSHPSVPPAESWHRLWPRLRPHLSHIRPGSRPDIPKLLTLICRGEAVQTVPTLPIFSLASDAWLYLDLSPPMHWLDVDMRATANRIRAWLGLATPGRTLVIQDGPDSVWYEPSRQLSPFRDEVESDKLAPLPLPPGKTPVLVITWCNTSTKRARWQGFVRRLKRQHLVPHFLSPSALPGSVTVWGPVQQRGLHQPVDIMMAVAVLSSWITPAMVRGWRLVIPGAGLKHELEFWLNSDLVTLNGQGGAVAGHAREKYLTHFCILPESLRNTLLDVLLSILDAHNPSLRHGVTTAVMALIPDWSQTVGQKRVTEAKQWWASAGPTLMKPERSDHFARWVMHYATQHQHTFTQGQNDLVSQTVVKAVQKLSLNTEDNLPTALTIRDRLAIGMGEADVIPRQLVLLGDELRLESTAQRSAAIYAAGVDILALHDCADLVVIDDSRERIDLRAGQSIKAPTSNFSVHTTAEAIKIIWQSPPPGTIAYGIESGAITTRLSDGTCVVQPATERSGAMTDEDWAENIEIDEYGVRATVRVKGESIRFRYCPPGEFMMGSPESELERNPDEQQHSVRLNEGFWLCETACSQSLWDAVMGDRPSHFDGDDLPVESVSWDRIVEDFLPALNELVPGLDARLPSEAQWEYACRAGSETVFSFGDELSPQRANYDGNYPYANQAKGEYRETTVSVYLNEPNAWGFYQIHGNVFEWCADSRRDYSEERIEDPWGGDGAVRVLRGGSWYSDGHYLRSAYRNASPSGNASIDLGFRLSRGPASKSPGGALSDVRGTRTETRDSGGKPSGITHRFLSAIRRKREP